MRAHLQRFADSPFGVFGILDMVDDAGDRVARFFTAEDDWLDNLLGQSAIPAGTYTCRRRESPKFGNTFRIDDVPGRSHILFHWGNTEEDVRGCVLLGERLGALTVEDEDEPGTPMTLKWAVLASRSAFSRFLALTAGLTEFPLDVTWAKPGAWRDST